MDFQPMSQDEMQRLMQFLLSQQAQFDANLQQLSSRTDRIAEGLIGLTGLVGMVNRSVGDLAARTDEMMRDTKARMDDLGAYISKVEAHLNVVIDMFDRHLREDHGRRPS